MARWATSDMPSARISPRIGMHLFFHQIYHLLKEFYINFQTFDDTNNQHPIFSPHLLHPLHLEQWNSHRDFASWTTRVFHSLTPSHPPAQLGMTWGGFCSSSNFLLNLNSVPWPADGTRYLVDVQVKNLLQVEAGLLPLHLLPPLLQLSLARDLPPHLLPADHLHLLQRILFSLPRLCEFLHPLLQLFRQMGKRYLVFNKCLAGTVLTKNQNYLNFNLKKMGFTCSVGTGEDSRKMKIPSVTPSNGVQSRQKNTFTVMTGTVHFISANQL